jgi:FtsZ-interacting cell division protein ZipA
MSTGLIIAIVVVALLLLVLFAFVLPRMRHNQQVKARERELERRRERVAGEHRAEAEERRGQADMAERKAEIAAAEAQRERAEAELREQRAQMHERGQADHELIDESERDRFAGTSAVRDEPGTTGDDRVRDESATDRGTVRDEERPMHEPAGDYEQGRIDEREERVRGETGTERTDDPSRPRPA